MVQRFPMVGNRYSDIRGLTWSHSRGMASVIAASAALTDFEPRLSVVWDAQPLKGFGEGRFRTRRYDLIAIDHPFVGLAARRGLLIPLERVISESWSASDFIGPSLQSYSVAEVLWAVPLDAAWHVSAARIDLLAQHRVDWPATFDEVLDLARAGLVAVPLRPVDAFCALLSILGSSVDDVFGTESFGQDATAIGDALEALRKLATAVDPCNLDRDPTQILSAMASGNSIAFVPYTFGYSNYARPEYAPNVVAFRPVLIVSEDRKPRGTLGGVGLAISTRAGQSPQRLGDVALLVKWLVSTRCQTGVFAVAGGQPARSVAWSSPVLDGLTTGFFSATLDAADDVVVRPNHSRFPRFQSIAEQLIHRYLRGGTATSVVATGLDRAYRAMQRSEEP